MYVPGSCADPCEVGAVAGLQYGVRIPGQGGYQSPTGEYVVDCPCICLAGTEQPGFGGAMACTCPPRHTAHYEMGAHGPVLVGCGPWPEGNWWEQLPPESDVPAEPWWEQAWDALPDWGGDPLWVDDAGGGRRSPPVPSSTSTSTSSRTIAAAAAGVLGLGLVLVASRRR